MTVPFKSIGSAAPVLFALAAVCWLALLRTTFLWIAKTPEAGRETGKMMQQAASGAAALLVWVFLGGLLLVANAKGLMPMRVGAASWIVHPLSCAAALAALAVAYDAQWRWALGMPVAAPLLIGGYAGYLFLADDRSSSAAWGLGMWGVMLALSLCIAPAAVVFARAHLDDGSIDATPGPRLDKWMGEQREKRRAEGLRVLSLIDGDTSINEIEYLTRGDSPVREEALAAIRRLPNRQAETVRLLLYESRIIMALLPDIDVQPTPELCAAGRYYLSSALASRAKMNTGPSVYVGAEFEDGINGIGWLARHCDCDSELARVEEYARAQQDVEEVRRFIAALHKVREESHDQSHE
ncbi:MAG TPA: hypothetical protein VNV86_21790 [Candidatus Acidoferrum sp.]|nr:hypothetical protein [Candidatus Acidoferrum sp.]